MNYVRAWLFLLLCLVFIMVIVGGLTRLTDSGLSITEWKPITGALPPLSAQGWLIEFQKYQHIPEFKLQNSEMTMSEFKVIYWWEWGHRQLGRVIGLTWGIGFLLLLFFRKFNTEPVLPSFLIGCLIGLQGAIGWWMVSSGLDGEMLDVLSYRLAIHLLTAFIILSIIYWRILHINYANKKSSLTLQNNQFFYAITILLLCILYTQIFSGALVAGIDAGQAYNEWPLMNGQILPSESFDLKPFWLNFTDNTALVQFNHRMLAYSLFFLALLFFIAARLTKETLIIKQANYLILVTFFQMALGIITVLNNSTLIFAALHQIGGMAFLIVVINTLFKVSNQKKSEIRC